MSVIRIFRDYMAKHHPHLACKDWKMDVRVLSTDEIRNEELRASIPTEFRGELRCWVFFYDGGESNVVYLLQDEQGSQNLGIGLLRKGELIKPISFV